MIKKELLRQLTEGRVGSKGGVPKRFTVKKKFRVGGMVFNTGDYAKKKERMGKTMVLNMDNNEMLSIEYQDYVAAVKNRLIQESKLTEIKKGDWIRSAYDELGLVNKVKGQTAYVSFDGSRSFHPMLVGDLTKTKERHRGKAVYAEGKLKQEKFDSKAQQRFLYATDKEAAKKKAGKMTKKDYKELPDKVKVDEVVGFMAVGALMNYLMKWADKNPNKVKELKQFIAKKL